PAETSDRPPSPRVPFPAAVPHCVLIDKVTWYRSYRPILDKDVRGSGTARGDFRPAVQEQVKAREPLLVRENGRTTTCRASWTNNQMRSEHPTDLSMEVLYVCPRILSRADPVHVAYPLRTQPQS